MPQLVHTKFHGGAVRTVQLPHINQKLKLNTWCSSLKLIQRRCRVLITAKVKKHLLLIGTKIWLQFDYEYYCHHV